MRLSRAAARRDISGGGAAGLSVTPHGHRGHPYRLMSEGAVAPRSEGCGDGPERLVRLGQTPGMFPSTHTASLLRTTCVACTRVVTAACPSRMEPLSGVSQTENGSANERDENHPDQTMLQALFHFIVSLRVVAATGHMRAGSSAITSPCHPPRWLAISRTERLGGIDRHRSHQWRERCDETDEKQHGPGFDEGQSARDAELRIDGRETRGQRERGDPPNHRPEQKQN